MTGLERLKVLLEWAADDQNISPEKLDMEHWCTDSPCGTVGCLIGWAAMNCEELKAEGIRLIQPSPHRVDGYPTFRNYSGVRPGYETWDRVFEFFGLDDFALLPEDTPLSVAFYDHDYGRSPTKFEVIAELRKFIQRIEEGKYDRS